MNKPDGVVCSAVSDSHKTVYQLLSPELQQLMHAKRGERLHTVGRLDCKTSGLLFITNDGAFSHQLTSPQNHIKKTYIATLSKPVQKQHQAEYISLFSSGMILPPDKKAPEQKILPAELFFLEENLCCLTISEGKFHQIRRMFLAANNEVIGLKRVSIGNYQLPPELKSGEYKFLNLSVTFFLQNHSIF